MKIIFIFSITVVFFLSSCSHSLIESEKVGFCFTKQYAQDMYLANNWILIGYGGGYHDKIEMLSFYFIAQDHLNLSQARIYIVKNMEILLSKINSDPILFPYLNKYPFTANQIDLEVHFYKDEKLNFLEPPAIAAIVCPQGKMGFAIFDKAKDELVTLQSESYEETKFIVNQTSQVQYSTINDP